MNDTYLILLLQLIKHDGDIGSLLEKGLEYSQIARYLSWVKDNGYSFAERGTIGLTPKGLDMLDELNAKMGRRNSDAWISPLDQYRIPKAKTNDPYFPSSRSLGK